MAVWRSCRAGFISDFHESSNKRNTGEINVIDILVYLFENYLPDAYPEPTVLARKLSAAGFEQDEISEALSWLDGLERNEAVVVKLRDQGTGVRVYDEEEQARLPVECRGFLAFLEQAGTLDPGLRETVVERALALSDGQVSLSKLKVIVLVVLWRRQHEFDALILEELMSSEDDGEYTCH
jgi:Smg protein